MVITTASDADAGTKDRIEIKVGDKGQFQEGYDYFGLSQGSYEKDM